MDEKQNGHGDENHVLPLRAQDGGTGEFRLADFCQEGHPGAGLKDRRLEQRAVAQRWPISGGEVRRRMIERMERAVLDPGTSQRDAGQAFRALMAADRINLEQEQRDAGGPTVHHTVSGAVLHGHGAVDLAPYAAAVAAVLGSNAPCQGGRGEGQRGGTSAPNLITEEFPVSRKLLAILLSELQTIRLICKRHNCGGIFEVAASSLASMRSPPICPLCGHPFVNPTSQHQSHIGELARVMVAVGQAPDVEVEFVIPDDTSVAP